MDNELEIWFDNFINRKLNNKILFIDNLNKEQIDRIRNAYENIRIRNPIKINFLDDTHQGEAFFIEFNSLVYLKCEGNFARTEILERNIIYVSAYEFILNFEKFINNFSLNNAFEIKDLIYNIEYFIIEKVSVKDIIENKDELLDKIRVRKQLLKSILGKDFDFDKIEIAESGYQDIKLVQYINILKNKNILITSLGHYLYRIFTLDFTSTTTRAGLNIKKDLNSKSKPFTYKNLIGKNVSNHNLKAYDLNINQIELETKIKIAKNLLSLRKEKLDYKTIAKVTELPEKVITNIQFSTFK